MTQVCWTQIAKGLRMLALAAALTVTSGAAEASDYGWRNHGWNGGGWHRPPPAPAPTPAPVVRSTSSSGSSRTYSAYYRQGGSGYGFLNKWARGSSNNGYSGAYTYINTPHRGDWNAKLQAQRQWDNEQYRKMQQAESKELRCGLNNAPAYCYRLKGPYPEEIRVVRY